MIAVLNRQPHLVGDLVELRPATPDDFDALFVVASDPLIWKVHPAHDRWQEPVFRRFFTDGLASGGMLVAVDRATGAVIGSSRYDFERAQSGEVEIGWTFLARSHWGGRYNGEMKRLMLDHAFRFVDTVQFAIAEDNVRSRRACEKIGATLSDADEARMTGGGPVNYCIYEIERADWNHSTSGQANGPCPE